MMYLLGLITGILISILIFVIEISLSKKETSIINEIKKLEKQAEKEIQEEIPKMEGSIIGTDEEVEVMEEIFANNAKKGRDTKLTELL